MTAGFTQCRYLRRTGEQCTAEAADPDGPILLCIHHLAQASNLIFGARRRGLVVGGRQ